MNRSLYLEGLARALDFLGDENRAAALSFYAEMLDERIDEGMSEEEAVEHMEKIETIAARFRDEYGVPADPEEEFKPMPAAADEDGEMEQAIPCDSSGDIDNEPDDLNDAPDAAESAESTDDDIEMNCGQDGQNAACAESAQPMQGFEAAVLNAARAASEAAQNAARGAIAAAKEVFKGIEVEMRGAGKAVEVPKEALLKTIKAPADAVKTITVRTSNDGVRIEKSTSGEASITYYTDECTLYETSFEGGNLMLKRLSSIDMDGGQLFRLFKNGFVFRRNAPEIVVQVPQDSLIDIDIVTSNGRASLNGLRGLGEVSIRTNNGALNCETASMLALSMKSSNGRINLNGVSVKRAAEARSSNAHIDAKGVFGGENVTFSTTNARLSASGIKAEGMLTMTTSNGGISFERLLARAYKFRTSNGGIHGTLPGNAKDYRISSGTSNGRNGLPPHQAGDISLEAFTSNGSIGVTFGE